MMLDPFGAMAIQRLTSYLSPTEDTIRLGMPAILLFNRLLWLAIGGAVLALLARRLEFRAQWRYWLPTQESEGLSNRKGRNGTQRTATARGFFKSTRS